MLLGTLSLPNTKDPLILKDSDAWRYFIAIPAAFSVLTILGTLLIVRYDTPMFLITQRRYDEAKKAIKLMFHKDDDHEAIF